MQMLYLLFYLSKNPEKSITVSTKHIEHIKLILTVIIIITVKIRKTILEYKIKVLEYFENVALSSQQYRKQLL